MPGCRDGSIGCARSTDSPETILRVQTTAPADSGDYAGMSHYRIERSASRHPFAKNFCRISDSKPDYLLAVRLWTSPNFRHPASPPHKSRGPGQFSGLLADGDCSHNSGFSQTLAVP